MKSLFFTLLDDYFCEAVSSPVTLVAADEALLELLNFFSGP